MFDILPLKRSLIDKIRKFNLTKKVEKQLGLLSRNPKHPSLNLELLEPKSHGIYSIRIDLKFRALLIFHSDKKSIEIVGITVHYR